MKKTILGLSLLFALIASTAIQAQDQQSNRKERKGPPTASKLLKKMDTNEDGKLSKTEVKGSLKKDFAAIDTDKDGFLSEAELEKMPAPQKGERPPRRE